MASIRDRFTPEIIEGLTRAYSDQVAGEVEKEEQRDPNYVHPLDDIKQGEVPTPDGCVLFSSVFWKPKTIPDIPLPMFQREDWDPVAQNYIPSVDPNWVWNRPACEAMALALYSGDTTLLHGLQGTGKSCLAEQWCATFNIPFWRMSCNKETREAHFVGSAGLDYDDQGRMYIKQEPTMLTESLRYGGLFCEDEAFRHNSALVLQSLREKSNRTLLLPDAPGRTADERRLTAPKGTWWYVLTDNTSGSGDHTGLFDAEVQDASTLDRIDAAIEVPYLGKPQERKILQGHTDLNKDIIDGMIDFAQEVRKAFKNQSLMTTMSVRALLSWATKTELMGHIGDALKLSWYNKLDPNEQGIVDDIFFQAFARKINYTPGEDE